MTQEVAQAYSLLETTLGAYCTAAELAGIREAFDYACRKHGDQLRLDGLPFISHPLAVAQIIADMGLDPDSIKAALLHDTVEDTDATAEEIGKKFSPQVAELVDGVTKLTRVQYTSKEEEQMENLRKMLMAMAKDIRVILIKISDRLHNVRTLKYKTQDKQKQIALETMEIYAPIAHRLGMQRVKWELEDTCLFYLDPIGYEDISNRIKEYSRVNEGFIEKICAEITERLETNGLRATAYGRVKHIYSLYRKMFSQNKQLEEVYDYFAFRVIVDTIPDCYNVLGHIHDQFKPIPGRFKDYIGTPKPNMYQSLHTAVIGRDGHPFEVQIRTWEMHQTAEYGIAAHWKYKQGVQDEQPGDEKKYEWIRRLLENQQEMDAEDFISTLKVDLFADEVFVFTPRGDVINLPAGASPIDFAYAIHSAVGNSMVGAKVNGRLVNYDYELQNGDIAEVVTSKSGRGPSRDWINIAKSTEARSKIRQWFKKEKREENILRGHQSFDSELRRNGLTPEDIADPDLRLQVAKRMAFSSMDDIFAAIGYGGLTAVRAVNRCKDELTHQNRLQSMKSAALRLPTEAPKRRVTESGVEVQGIENCLTKFSRCCNPVPGDAITGFITRGFGVSIHRLDCANVQQSLQKEEDKGRWVSVNWANDPKQCFDSRLSILAKDKDGLVLDIVTVLSALRVKATSLNARNVGEGMAEVAISVSVNDLEQLNQVISKINRLSGISEVRRTNG